MKRGNASVRVNPETFILTNRSASQLGGVVLIESQLLKPGGLFPYSKPSPLTCPGLHHGGNTEEADIAQLVKENGISTTYKLELEDGNGTSLTMKTPQNKRNSAGSTWIDDSYQPLAL